MRLQSEYEVPCECGQQVRSHARIMVCPNCQRHIEVQFPQWVPASAMARLCKRIAAEKAKVAA